MLERVQRAVAERAPGRRTGKCQSARFTAQSGKRDERVREHTQPLHDGKGEQRSGDRAGQPAEERERRQVADQDVLDHVEREQLVLADRLDRARRARARAGRARARTTRACHTAGTSVPTAPQRRTRRA